MVVGKGRRHKCTDGVTQVVAHGLNQGLPFETSCRLAGISKQTGYNWLTWGEEGRVPFVDFLDAIKRAEAEGEARLVGTVSAAMGTHWQAAAWMLERRFPDRWGRRAAISPNAEQAVLSPEDQAALKAHRELRAMTPDQVAIRLRELEALRAQLQAPGER